MWVLVFVLVSFLYF